MEDGVHVVVVRLVHLLQEAALLVHGFVTYQTLQYQQHTSDIFATTVSRPCLLKVWYHFPQKQMHITQTYMFDIKEHSGRLICC